MSAGLRQVRPKFEADNVRGTCRTRQPVPGGPVGLQQIGGHVRRATAVLAARFALLAPSDALAVAFGVKGT